MLIDFLRSLVRIRLVGSFFSAILLDFLLAYELSLLYVFLFPFILVVHRGVVGNIQAFHVCAPGSIPGDGVFSTSFFVPYAVIYLFLPFIWIPTIAQLVERRTVVVNRFP